MWHERFGNGVFEEFGFQDGELDKIAVYLGDLRDDLLLSDGRGAALPHPPRRAFAPSCCAARPDRLRPFYDVGDNETI